MHRSFSCCDLSVCILSRNRAGSENGENSERPEGEGEGRKLSIKNVEFWRRYLENRRLRVSKIGHDRDLLELCVLWQKGEPRRPRKE
jgi:hypothetical protein